MKKRITPDELQEFLRKHKLWLEGNPDGERANLDGANLDGANLDGANLYGANLVRANLDGANLDGAKHIPPIACPEKGSFTAFKNASGYIVELLIPEDARRCSATSRKCRCDKAMVVSITTLSGDDAKLTEVASSYNSKFVYKVGELVEEPKFDDNRWKECSSGIHFVITRQEAVEY